MSRPIELRDGRLWMLMRTQTGFLYESFSRDQGENWSEAGPSRFISSSSPYVDVMAHARSNIPILTPAIVSRERGADIHEDRRNPVDASRIAAESSEYPGRRMS